MQLTLSQLIDANTRDTAESLPLTLSIPPGKSLLLHHVSWTTFENLLMEMGDTRAARIAYDNGTVEIMAPLSIHEYYKEVISDLIKEIADELDLNFESFGSTTWRRQDRLAGIEPDNCFYFQNEPAIRGKVNLDLAIDPPPDLAIEIDITSKSLDHLPIYARLGIPEVWRYDEGTLKIYHLQNQSYVEQERSLALPMIPVPQILPLIDRELPNGRKAMRRAARAWARQVAFS